MFTTSSIDMNEKPKNYINKIFKTDFIKTGLSNNRKLCN